MFVTVPDMGAGRCLGPEGNGVSLGEGGKGGLSPPGSKKDKQSVLSEGRGNMEKDQENGQVGRDKEVSPRTGWAIFSKTMNMKLM
jgi:hypothetical protein